MAKTKKTKRRAKSKASSKASRKSSKRAAERKARRKAAPKRGGSKKVSGGRRKAAASKARAPKRKAVRSKVRRPVAKKAKPVAKPKRLPPRKRHAVERDESRERVGDAEGEAFVGTDTDEDEAKELGEEFVRSVTSGEEAESEMEEEETVEEQGGPFVVTSASTEYGFGTDESNPADAEKAPFPQVSPAVSPKRDEDEDQ